MRPEDVPGPWGREALPVGALVRCVLRRNGTHRGPALNAADHLVVVDHHYGGGRIAWGAPLCGGKPGRVLYTNGLRVCEKCAAVLAKNPDLGA